jgi:hypothetical protein
MAARENFALQMKRELIECFFLSTIKVIRILFEDGFQLKSLPAVTKARKIRILMPLSFSKKG